MIINYTNFLLLLMALALSACMPSENAVKDSTGLSPITSNIQNDPDVLLASGVIESMNTTPVVTGLGSADVGFDLVLGPVLDHHGDSKAFIFSYDRNALLQWNSKPFFIHEFNLGTFVKSESIVLPEGQGFMGLVSRYSVNTPQNKIRILTSNPFNVIDWDYENKVGTLIKSITANTTPLFHHYDLASDSFCTIDKLGTAYRLHTIKNGHYNMHPLGFLGSPPLALICDDNYAYLSVKATNFKLYALDLQNESAQIISDQTIPNLNLIFYDIQSEQYVGLTRLDIVTHKNITTYYKLNGITLSQVAHLPTSPSVKTYDIKLDTGRATINDPRVPVRIRQLKPTLGTWNETKLSFHYRPEVITNLFAKNSHLYLSGKALVKFSSDHFSKLGNPYNLVINNFIQVNDKFIMSNGGTQLYLYDPDKNWTWEPNYLTTIPSNHANANPKLITDLKPTGIVSIKKILPWEDKVLIGATVQAKTKSRFITYNPEDNTISQSANQDFDINDFLISEDKIYATTYSGVVSQKIFFALFDATTMNFETKYQTLFPANQFVKIFSSVNGYYLTTNKQFIRLDENGTQNLTQNFTSILPKFIKTPNNKFLTIFNNKLVIVNADGHYNVITDLAPLSIIINDYELINNKLYIATKYGIIYEIKIPLATITLND